MAQEGTQESRRGQYIVIATVETKYENCRVIPADNVYDQGSFKAFGPDTQVKCEEWKRANCVESKG